MQDFPNKNISGLLLLLRCCSVSFGVLSSNLLQGNFSRGIPPGYKTATTILAFKLLILCKYSRFFRQISVSPLLARFWKMFCKMLFILNVLKIDFGLLLAKGCIASAQLTSYFHKMQFNLWCNSITWSYPCGSVLDQCKMFWSDAIAALRGFASLSEC